MLADASAVPFRNLQAVMPQLNEQISDDARPSQVIISS
jgi:hypothetical protein